ncbi:uncharacterized protein PG986_004371 [Apiospora aurea]|uniref:Uncharacterized protein n=1 Tax=Apiospora aurea TaxID=335848 RepID=A0ABR1QMV7_9PEZI
MAEPTKTISSFPAEAPQTSGPDKKQPWRAIYPCLQKALAVTGAPSVQLPATNVASSWHYLERGLLPRPQEDLLGKMIQEKFDGKPWYESEKDPKPDPKPKPKPEPERCESCGNSPCTCSVFEGG